MSFFDVSIGIVSITFSLINFHLIYLQHQYDSIDFETVCLTIVKIQPKKGTTCPQLKSTHN